MLFSYQLYKILNKRDLKFLIFIGYLMALILGLYHHEMWRDEYEEFLQARDANGFFGLENTMSQGHAMLWQACLWVITRFTHNPMAMKVFHGIIVSCSAYVILYKSPFKLWQSGLMLLGYFFLFEYALISRCYAFGVLFFMLFASIYTKNKCLNWKGALCLFLLANTSIYAMMLCAVLMAWLFIMEFISLKKEGYKNLMKCLPIFTFVAIGILLAYFQIRPNANNSLPITRVIWPFNFYRFQVAISQFFYAFFPICKFQYLHFWNSNLLGNKDGVCHWVFPILTFILTSIPFVFKPKHWMLWISGVTIILFFQYHTGFYFSRYYGHFLIWWIVCLWLASHQPLQKISYNLPINAVLAILLTWQAIGGILVYKADWKLKFSRGAEVAKYLKANGHAKSYLIGSVDFALSPIAAELDCKIYYMQHMALSSHTIWDKNRLNSMDSNLIVKALESNLKNRPMVFIATHPIMEFQYFKERANKTKIHKTFSFDKFQFNCLAYFKPGIEYYEGYWIFEVQRLKM
jgi:hypothetical protein